MRREICGRVRASASRSGAAPRRLSWPWRFRRARSILSKWHEKAAGALSGPASSHRTRPATRRETAALVPGEVAEWSNAPHSKCGIGASLSGVRIPPSPPSNLGQCVSPGGQPSQSAIDKIALLDFTSSYGEAISPQGDMPKNRVRFSNKDASCQQSTQSPLISLPV